MKTNNVNHIHIGFHRMSTNNKFITVLGGRFSDSGCNKWYPGYPIKYNDWDCGYIYIYTNGLLCNNKNNVTKIKTQ